MSRIEWEEGTITLPAEEYAKVRRRVISAWNTEQTALYKRALRVKEAAHEAGYRKRNFSRAAWVQRRHPLVAHLITRKGCDKVYMPRKKDLQYKPVSRSVRLRLTDCATISFDNKRRTVVWRVSEENHACEIAKGHPVAVTLFNALHRVEWTRDTGGIIVGNDEYNRDNRSFDGGANYEVERFGIEKPQRFNGMFFE
jgi:hypothetical protein